MRVSFFSAMNRRASNSRTLLLTCLVIAATAPSGVIAFQQSGSSGPAPKPGDSKVNPMDGLRYRWIPAGMVTTGCSQGDKECYADEYPPRKITLTKGFWLGETEVTQAAFEKIMDYNPSVFQDEPNFPVENVSWQEADAYCTAINGRLPSAAEWEYAARGGTGNPRYGNIDDVAWYLKNSDFTVHPVGKKKPNAFGLYDMLGNVSEWTHTWYWVQLNQENINPTGPSLAEFRELRGGGWWDEPDIVRASYRSRVEPETQDFGLGLRCVSE
jgi:formylglycine-generating enzyme required for sulfatase activity